VLGAKIGSEMVASALPAPKPMLVMTLIVHARPDPDRDI
jgi:hypothetical protein